MKRGILIITLLILLSSLVSAGLFSGVWEDYLTGRQVQDVSSADLTINEKPYFLKPGDSLVIDGETVKLITITSDGSISVSVGGMVGVSRLGYGPIGLDVKGKIFYISINKLIYNGKELSIVSVAEVCIDSDNSNPNIINGGLKDLDDSVYIEGKVKGLDFDGNSLVNVDSCGFTPKGGDPSYPDNILQYSISGPYLVEQFCCSELNIGLKGRICASTKSCPNGCKDGACAGVVPQETITPNKFTLKVDESFVFSGKMITLDNVGSTGAIAINVDGISEVINKGNTETVNGIEITNAESFYNSKDRNLGSATIIIGGVVQSSGGVEIVQEISPEVIPITYANIQVNNLVYTFDLNKGIEIDGKKVVLLKVGLSGAIVISVNGVTEVISPGITEIVNGLEIKNTEVIYQGNQIYPKIEETTEVIEITKVECQSPNSLTYEQISCMNNVIDKSGLSEKSFICDADEFIRFSQYSGCTEPQVAYLAYSCIYNKFVDIRDRLSTCKLPIPLSISIESTEEGPILIEEGEQVGKVIFPPEGVGLPLTCNGCLINNKCLPYGTRLEGQYCNIESQLQIQKELSGACDNSYECKSNECSNNECISTAGLLQKLLDFLSKIFGKE